MNFSQLLFPGAVTVLAVIASTPMTQVLTASKVDAVAQPTKQIDSQSQQKDDTAILSSTEINGLAAQTTVIIGQDLQKGDIEAQREFNPGSGVLIAKRGNTYYAATNLHVVRGRGGFYGVRTYDGEVYPVDDESTRAKIHLLGEEQGENAQTIRGLDLAIVQFTSKKEYPVATVNYNSQLKQGEQAFVSGWPDPSDQSPQRKRFFAPGELTNVTNAIADGGYNLQYTCQTRRGMSGGPVFNAKGEVIGIHGRAGEAQVVFRLNDQIAHLIKQAKTNPVPPAANRGSNLGIQVNSLIGEAEKYPVLASIFPSLVNLPPLQQSVISSGVQNRPRSADVIDDIYKTFSRDFKHAAVRDCPSGGSGTLLLGDDDARCPD